MLGFLFGRGLLGTSRGEFVEPGVVHFRLRRARLEGCRSNVTMRLRVRGVAGAALRRSWTGELKAEWRFAYQIADRSQNA